MGAKHDKNTNDIISDADLALARDRVTALKISLQKLKVAREAQLFFLGELKALWRKGMVTDASYQSVRKTTAIVRGKTVDEIVAGKVALAQAGDAYYQMNKLYNLQNAEQIRLKNVVNMLKSQGEDQLELIKHAVKHNLV